MGCQDWVKTDHPPHSNHTPGFDHSLDGILEAERTTPLWKPATLFACFLGIIAMDILKVRGRLVGWESDVWWWCMMVYSLGIIYC